ncbi:histidine phosphatase family protein [bacterium]|nr:histidine phosphatase family protein [bacterium]
MGFLRQSVVHAFVVVLAASTPALAGLATCAGDCDGDQRVTVDELVRGVNIALGQQAPESCSAFDRNGDGQVTVDELLAAVAAAIGGCSATIPPSATMAATAPPTLTATVAATALDSATPSPSATPTDSAVPTATVEPTDTATPTASATATAADSATPTHSAVPTHSATPTATVAPTDTAMPTASATATAADSATPAPSTTPTDSAVPTATVAPTDTATATASATATAADSATPTPSATPTDSAVPTATLAPTDAATATASATATAADSATPAPSATPTDSAVPTATLAPTDTATPTASETATPSATATPTPSIAVSDLSAVIDGDTVRMAWTNPDPAGAYTQALVLRRLNAPVGGPEDPDATPVFFGSAAIATHPLADLLPTTEGHARVYHYAVFPCTPLGDCLGEPATAMLSPTIVEVLRAGGYVIFWRHASAFTCQDRTDYGPAATTLFPDWWKSCDATCTMVAVTATARQLSDTGRGEATAIGAAFAERGIPVGRVLSSEFCRARQTAELMDFGPPIETREALTYFVHDEANRCADTFTLLMEPPPPGTNTALIGHAGNTCPPLSSLSMAGAVIYKPNGDGAPVFIDAVTWDQWAALP